MSLSVEFIELKLEAKVTSESRVGGGDFANAYRLTLDDGRQLFVKTHTNPPPGFFTTEASGLQWLSQSSIRTPEVVLVADDPPVLALEWIEPGRSHSLTEKNLGAALASLHQQSFASFGRPDLQTTGSLGLPNAMQDGWPEFYSSCRLLPLAKIAFDRQVLTPGTIKNVERIAGNLAAFGAADEPPALLHGDLWAGNRLVDQQGESWLIDPAAHGGHREFDIAMMHLFGGYSEECFESYNDAYPLQADWQQRMPLHQLAPLLVHAIKFGGHYVAAVEQVADQFASV